MLINFITPHSNSLDISSTFNQNIESNIITHDIILDEIKYWKIHIDKLNIDRVVCPKIYEGQGFVRCQHGQIPIPVPAVVNIAIEHGLRLHYTQTKGELITPTGAAIIAGIQTEDKLPEEFIIKKIGIGAGKRKYDIPNVVRAMMIEVK